MNALQITDFDFYGDNLIALKDNATGEIYTAITHILRGIGFTDKQVEYQRKKFITDPVISKGTLKFLGVDLNMPSIDEVWCISNRKLPLALAKINITPKMKREQPELSIKLELYQDKCADVLASVFIDNKQQPILEVLNSITTTLQSFNDRLTRLEENQMSKRRFSYWASKMFPKYQLLLEYFDLGNNYNKLYGQLFIEFQNMYPDIELNQIKDDYCYENKLDNCYTLDAIEHDKTVRVLFETMVDNLLEKYNLVPEKIITRNKTIFDD